MASVPQIRGLIRGYLSGEIDLQSFSDEFDSVYAELNHLGSPDSLEIADKVQVFLARISSHLASESDLKSWLLPLSSEQVSANIIVTMSSVPSSVNHVVVEERAFPADPAPSDTSLAREPWSAECLPI